MKKLTLSIFVIFSIAFISLQSKAQTIELTEIPQWLTESETYGFAVDWDEIEGTAWKFVTHIPHSKEFLGEAKKRGIRATTRIKRPIAISFMGFVFFISDMAIIFKLILSRLLLHPTGHHDENIGSLKRSPGEWHP